MIFCNFFILLFFIYLLFLRSKLLATKYCLYVYSRKFLRFLWRFYIVVFPVRENKSSNASLAVSSG